MQVRYQAAPRPDRTFMIAEKAPENSAAPQLAAKYFDQLFELEPHLVDELLALIEVYLRVIAGQPVAGSADGESLLVKEAADLPDDEHVLPLVVTAIAPALDRLQLGEFLLPIAQHVRLDAAQIADLTDGEVALPRDRRQLAVIAWFQHTPRREPLISGRAGRSPRDAR